MLSSRKINVNGVIAWLCTLLKLGFSSLARQLRIEFEGALYHVTARGNARQAIYTDDRDRARFVDLLAREVAQQHWR